MLVGMMREFRLFVRPFGLNRRIKGENRSTGGKMNPNAIRKGGVVVSVVKDSVREETPQLLAASKVAVKVLKAAVARGDLKKTKKE